MQKKELKKSLLFSIFLETSERLSEFDGFRLLQLR